jgi:hypothetical protein
MSKKSTESLQAHEKFPKGVFEKNKTLFNKLLPGWNPLGEYNLAPAASTQMAAKQLDLFVHSGSHSWINDGILDLIKDNKFDGLPEANKRVYLAALVNFMSEAGSPEALASGGAKTGGFVAFTSKRDPELLQKFGTQPTTDQMRAYSKDFINWETILGSQAGKEIVDLNVREVNGKLVYDGKLAGTGFFSKASTDLDSWKAYSSSTEFSSKYAEEKKIKAIPGGAVSVDGHPVKYQEAFDTLHNKPLGNGNFISDFNKLPKTLLKKVGGVLLTSAAVIVLSTSAEAAQNKPTYDPVKIVPENKALISEIFGVAIGGLAGTVAGVLAGAASLGVLAFPAAIGASIVGEQIGKYLGNFFYDQFPGLGNSAAEWIAPILAPVANFAVDSASAIYGFVSDALEYIQDQITGPEGLFGLNGPLFGDGGPLERLVDYVQKKGFLQDDGEWRYDSFDSILRGNDGDDWLIHDGWGEAYGEEGDDFILGVAPVFIKSGNALFDEPGSPVAQGDQQLTLDGGPGDDWVLTIGGAGAITIGGPGRDFIFNTSEYGQLYGDTVDGVGQSKAGKTDSDVFWYWPGTFIMDAQPNDLLQLFGLPLLGGTNTYAGVPFSDGSFAVDWLFPFVFYGRTDGNQLLVINALSAAMDIGPKDMKGVMVVENYDFGGLDETSFGRPKPGDLGMTFRIARGGEGSIEISVWSAVWGELLTRLDVLWTLTKALRWQPVDDPLVIDLDGDGIETTSELQSGVHFDFDGDFFAESAGWLSADDGFLVLDRDGNGRIEDVSEMFGGPDTSGFARLAELDGNGDGAITAADAGFAALRVWRDLDQDGATDAGELSTLADLGLVSLAVAGTRIDTETPQGNRVLAGGSYTRADGTTGSLFDMVFKTNPTDTIFRGERGTADWLKAKAAPDAKGFGAMTSLAVGQSNDFDLAETVALAAAAATTPTLKAVRAAITPVFGAWAQSLELTRELTPMLVKTDAAGPTPAAATPAGATLVDRAVYVEDAAGGFWQLKSGRPVTGAAGDTIPRPTLADVVAQATAEGETWRLEQMFSPSTRATAVADRTEAPSARHVSPAAARGSRRPLRPRGAAAPKPWGRSSTAESAWASCAGHNSNSRYLTH